MEEINYIGDKSPSNGLLVNYQRFFGRALRHWYVFLITLLFALGGAFLANRYALRIYPVEMSILIKESEEASGSAEILYNNPLVDAYRNFYNELYIIKSYPVIEEVIKQLGFNTAIFVEGNVKETQLYKTLPIDFWLLSFDREHSSSFELELIDSASYRLTVTDGSVSSSQSVIFSNADTVSFCGVNFYTSINNNLLNFTYNSGKKYNLYFYSNSVVTSSYINKLKVEWAEEGASVVNLEVNGAVVEKEKDFLNTLFRHYSFQDLEKKNIAATRSLKFIEEQLTSISDSLIVYEIQLENFKNNNTLTDLGEEAKRVLVKIEEFEEQRVNLIVQNSYLDYLKKYINESQNYDQIVLPMTVGVNDPILSDLVRKMIDIQFSIKSFISIEAKNNPLYKEKKSALENIRGSLTESVSNLGNTNQIKLASIDEQIGILTTQIKGLPKAERKLITIQRNYKFSENLYNFLSQKRTEAGISKASAISDILVINPAMQKTGLISPNPKRNYLIALVIGIGIPLVLFFLIEYFNNKVQSKEDIEGIVDIPISGLIGHHKQKNSIVVNSNSKSAVAESFRTLRSNLHFFANKKEKKVFMVTSSISGEGKSFTCMNLGAVMALAGKKTVIIGGDMRKPKMFNEFSLNNEVGLSTLLSGNKTIEEVLQKTKIDNLFLISAGPVPPNPSEMLMQEDMKELILSLQKEFDSVIIDTPPIALVTDALVISPLVDHTIYITRQGFTPIVAIKNIAELYKDGKIKNISVILNDIKNNRPGYGYGYGYGYSYGYGNGYYEQ